MVIEASIGAVGKVQLQTHALDLVQDNGTQPLAEVGVAQGQRSLGRVAWG